MSERWRERGKLYSVVGKKDGEAGTRGRRGWRDER